MITDWLWNLATSSLVLGALAVLTLVAFVVAHVPALVTRLVPGSAPYTVLAHLVQLIAFALLMFLLGFRVADEREHTRRLQSELAWQHNELEQQKASAEDAARLRDQKTAEAEALQTRVENYEAQLAMQPIGTCALDDADITGLRALGGAGKNLDRDPARLRGLGRNRAAP